MATEAHSVSKLKLLKPSELTDNDSFMEELMDLILMLEERDEMPPLAPVSERINAPDTTQNRARCYDVDEGEGEIPPLAPVSERIEDYGTTQSGRTDCESDEEDEMPPLAPVSQRIKDFGIVQSGRSDCESDEEDEMPPLAPVSQRIKDFGVVQSGQSDCERDEEDEMPPLAPISERLKAPGAAQNGVRSGTGAASCDTSIGHCSDDQHIRGRLQELQDDGFGAVQTQLGEGDVEPHVVLTEPSVVHQMVEEEIQAYCLRVGAQSQIDMAGLGQTWSSSESLPLQIKSIGDDQIQAKLALEMSLPQGGILDKRSQMCRLIAQTLQAQHQERIKGECTRKDRQRSEYGIGWKVEHIPRNDEAASKLAMSKVPQGMVSLLFDSETNSILLASTREPSAALNLEYLSTSLQVRRTEGHEPIFSLDPARPEDPNSMQAKVFRPEWIAGTTVGEVLFQADYHLKELSMGEYAQPVVGMKSCLDHSEADDRFGWSAREWFLVRKAEVMISDSSMLIPLVKMGVEAREQVVSCGSVQDKPVTCMHHPMAKYAEAFTRNFDLIAERKSVIYHLRELAKASVMAKFLLDSKIQLEESWFHLAENKEMLCSLEVPQIWNERVRSEVRNVEGEYTQLKHVNSVFGGVQFGLDKFSLSTGASRRASVQAVLSRHQLASAPNSCPSLVPASYIQSMANGELFAPSSSSLSAPGIHPARVASITDVPRLATSMAAKLPSHSASLSASVVPRSASGISVTKLSPMSAEFVPPSASLSAKVGPRVPTSIGTSPGTPRAPCLSGKFSPSSATLSSSVTPRLATSIGAGIGIARTPSLSGKPAPSATLSSSVAPRVAASIGAGIGTVRAPSLSGKLASSSATLSSSVSPHPATSIGAGIGVSRAPLLSGKLAPSSATLSSSVAPRLENSIGKLAPVLSAKVARPSASLSSKLAPRLTDAIGVGVGLSRAPALMAKFAAPASLSDQVAVTLAGGKLPMLRSTHVPLQGVDLRLDQFDLTKATHMSPDEQVSGWAADVKPVSECVALGDAFFACLDGSKKLLDENDRCLLQRIFHPALNDRRQEGDMFMPPSARHAYVQKLRALVRDEDSVRAKRKEAFLKNDFKIKAPGLLFPHSWNPSVELPENIKTIDVELQPCPEYKEHAAVLFDRVVNSTALIFDKGTEEGTRFRIYRYGNLEVRTTQEFEGEEVIGAVYSELAR